MEKFIIDINNPYHPLNMSKYPEDQWLNSFIIDLTPETLINASFDEVRINWGDGDGFKQRNLKHSYKVDRFPLFYRIEVEFNPDLDSDFLSLKNNKYLKRIMGPLPRVSNSLFIGYFKGCNNLEMIGENAFKYNSNHRNMTDLFSECKELTYIDPSFKLEPIIIDGILADCIKLAELPSIFNFKSIESANKSFMNMTSLIRIPMNYLEDAYNLKSTISIFEGCSNLIDIGYNPLYNCKSLKDASRAFAEIDTNKLKIKDNFFTYIPKDCIVENIFTK